MVADAGSRERAQSAWSTDATLDGLMSQPLTLNFSAPRRGKPPRHLVDLDPAERRAVMAALDEPPFRADELSWYVFGRFADDDPASWTDVPEQSRERLARTFLPRLVTEVRHV